MDTDLIILCLKKGAVSANISWIFMKSVTSLTKAIAPAVHVIHSCSVDAVVGSLAVQGHLIPLLLRRDRAQTHVGQAGQGSSSKSSNSVDAQRMDRFLIKDLEQTKKFFGGP